MLRNLAKWEFFTNFALSESKTVRQSSLRLTRTFAFCEAEYYIAYRDGKPVGRIAAIINKRANETWGLKAVRFGWFDFIDDIEVSTALINKVKEYGRARGLENIIGPLGFTDMDREGLLVEGFENESPFTVLYNYPYYGEFLERMGFAKDADWTQRYVNFDDQLPPMMQYAELVEKRYGLKIYRASSLSQMARRGREMFHVLNDAFAPLYEYSKLSEEQIDGYVKQYVPVLNKDLVAFVVNEEDKLVAFTVTMPHISAGVRKARGRILPFGWIHILPLLNPRRNHVAEGLLIGVLPEYQAKGAALLMFKYLHENYLRLGIKRLLLNPQLEDNHKVQSLFSGYDVHPYQRRRSYVKAL